MKPFLDADYAAIEARIVCWLAGEEEALQEYRMQDAATTPEDKARLDRYRIMASVIFGVAVEDVNKHPQRFVGKNTILGCGFQAGAGAIEQQCLRQGYKLPMGLAETAVDGFRAKHKKIVRYWSDVEKHAKQAITNKGQTFTLRNVSFRCQDVGGMPFLLIKLPSGRKLAYPQPRLVPSRFEGKTAIAFLGRLGASTAWGRCDTYGGKLVENCLSGETQVLSQSRGWVKIHSVTVQDRIWDGVEFVSHHGLLNKGRQSVIGVHGVNATPDHNFLTADGSWVSAQVACTEPICKLYTVNEISFLPKARPAFRLGRGLLWKLVCAEKSPKCEGENCLGMLVRVWQGMRENWFRDTQTESSWVFSAVPSCEGRDWGRPSYSQHEPSPGLRGAPEYVGTLLKPEAPSLEELRGQGDNCLRKMGRVIRGFLGRHGANIPKGSGHRPKGQRWQLLARELPVGNTPKEHPESEKNFKARGCSGGFLGRSSAEGHKANHPLLSAESGNDLGADSSNPCGRKESVYDILNCGPRRRFAVKGTGPILIAHNCTQAVAADIMANGVHNAENAGYETATLIHDQDLSYFFPERGQTPEEFVKLLTTLPAWAEGLPIAAEGGLVPFYKKD